MAQNSELSGPLYQRVHDAVRARIISGDLAPGVMLPSEFDLAEQYAVSQGTARKAISKLELLGLVKRHQGKGTFVATTTDETSRFHFFRLRYPDESQAFPQPLSETICRRRASSFEATVLGLLTPAAAVFEIMRVRSIDGVLVCAEQSVLDAALFPGLNDRGALPNALYPLYQRSYGVTIASAKEQLRAVAASAVVAGFLQTVEGSPVLEVTRRSIGLNGSVVELRRSYYLTETLHYSVTLS